MQNRCVVVGVGASAGGLEALISLLEGVKPPTGLALVVLQHCQPDHETLLPKLLGRHTELPVKLLSDGEIPVAERIYVVPAGCSVELRDGSFVLSGHDPLHTPIDRLFRSLAGELGARCSGVLLSGAGSDGTLGLKAIRDSGGFAVVQDPSTAAHVSMPSSAISQRATDCVSKPEDIVGQIINYFRTPPLKRLAEDLDSVLPEILELVKVQTGRDFAYYKRTTMQRRVLHRMGVCRLTTGEDYLAFIENHPGEAECLAGELLVGVTSFFRDPEAYQTLESCAFPDLTDPGRTQQDTVRIWVPGCSTGEEAYSIAISFMEHLEKTGRTDLPFTVFATDLDTEAIETARLARYPEGVKLDVPSQFLEKYFVQSGEHYELLPAVREKVTFAVHSVFRDPPFSRMDLISCRNLLIYLQPELQEEVVSLLHYSLKPEGFLLLGHSENIGRFTDHFQGVDRKWKLFRKLPHPRISPRSFPLFQGTPSVRTRELRPALQATLERTLLDQFCPTAVVTDLRGEILYIHGDSERYLVPPKGPADFSLLKMARDELKAPLMSLFTSAMKNASTLNTVATMGGEHPFRIELEARPFRPTGSEHPRLMLVVFHSRPAEDYSDEPQMEADRSRIRSLEKELAATQAYLRTTIEELETTNEELETVNEELQSANEELHSTNEELETSREELQSVNEQLSVVNDELREELEICRAGSSETTNFLNSSELAVIHVDNKVAIQRFTPAASRLVRLLHSDVGRPLEDLAFRLDLGQESLASKVRAVIQSLSAVETEVRSTEGQWYAMRIKPYRTLDNVIEGALLTFDNISKQKEQTEYLRVVSEIAVHAPQSLMMLEPKGTVLHRNPQCTWRDGETPAFWEKYLSAGEEKNWSMLTRHLDDSGGLTCREVAVRPVADESGRTVRLVASEWETRGCESLFEALGGHLLYLNADGMVLHMSLDLAEVLDCSRESVKGKNWMERFVVKRDHEKAKTLFLSGGDQEERRDVGILTPGGPLVFRWRDLGLTESFPGKTCRIFAGENITERHRARLTIGRSAGLMKVFRILHESIRSGHTEEATLHTVCEALVSEAGYSRAWLGFVDLEAMTAMDPVVASGHSTRLSSPADLLNGVLGGNTEGPSPFVHHDQESGVVAIVLPLQMGETLGLLELDSHWEAFSEDEVEALRQFSGALIELLGAIREH